MLRLYGELGGEHQQPTQLLFHSPPQQDGGENTMGKTGLRYGQGDGSTSKLKPPSCQPSSSQAQH